MGRAVLEIAGDTTQLTRAIARIPRIVKAAADAIKGDFGAAMREATAAAETAEKAHQQAARAMRAASRAATRTTSEEERARTRATQQESHYRQAAIRDEVQQAETTERQRTRIARRGAEERARIHRREMESRRAAAGAVGATAGGMAASGASGALSMVRGAMTSAAAIDTRLNDSLIPAGFRDPSERMAARAAILARARSSGIGADRIADALANAQEFTSLLSGGTARERSSNLSGALEAVDFAADSRQDIGQVLRLRGVLAQQGVRGADARASMMALTGIGRAGSIELGNLTKEALGPLMQNISFATGRLGPGATPEQRAAAVRQATVRTLAVGEVGAAAGLSSRDSLNAMAKLDRYTQNPTAMGHLHERLMGRGRAGRTLAAEMFERARDAGGNQIYRLRGRYTDSLQMTSALLRHTGGNSAELANMLASSGPGRPMVMDSQTRRLVMGLASQTGSGESIADRVQRMAGEGNYSESDLAAERQARLAEQTTVDTRNEETRRAALNDNTGELRNLNNRLAAFAAEHPIVAAGAASAAVSAAPTVGRAAAQTLAGGGRSAVTGGGARAGAARLARAGGILGFFTSLLTPGNEDQGYFDDRAAINAHRAGGATGNGTAAGQRGNLREFQAGLQNAVAQGVREGMATAPVQVPPAAQQHVTTQTNLAQGARPTTGR
jgi:hypothetical protein